LGAVPELDARTVLLVSRADLGSASDERAFARLSARADPRGAVRAVEGAFRHGLGLSETLWVAGEPLAFDRASRESLAEIERALRERDEVRSRARIEALLREGEPRVEARAPIP
jgi:hypothetical protein